MNQVPEIRIPPRYVDPLRVFRDLAEESAERLFSALDPGVPVATRSQLLTNLRTQLPELGSEDASGLLDALLSLSAFRMSHPYSVDDLAEAVSIADGLKEDGVDRARFARRLVKGLSTTPLALTAKALDVGAADERLYHSCRIVTDVRPIFGEDPSKPPVSAVVVHSLQITYFRDNRVQSFYVALDDADLKNLKEVVDRAADKAASLRAFLVSAGLTPADTEGG